jgi:hypothetical protein
MDLTVLNVDYAENCQVYLNWAFETTTVVVRSVLTSIQ